MAGTARLAAGLTCLLLLLVVVNVAETTLRLEVVHPQAPDNYSEVQLTCEDVFGPVSEPPAVFKFNDTDIAHPGVVSNLVQSASQILSTNNRRETSLANTVEIRRPSSWLVREQRKT